MSTLVSPDGEWTASPIECLDRAVDGGYRLLVVRFGNMPGPERKTLMELIGALKRNSHTRDYPVLALLPGKHRKLLEDLARAKVDGLRYLDDSGLDAIRLREIIDSLGPSDRPAHQLTILCPFLHYSEIDSCREITVCGAYLDRMTLGGARLRELCHTGEHLACEYYLKPRRAS